MNVRMPANRGITCASSGLYGGSATGAYRNAPPGVRPLPERTCTRGRGQTPASGARLEGLPRLREAEVDPGGGRIRPARRDHLAAGVEVDPFRPVDVRVAEERVFPAAERVVRHRHRDRNVDPDHAGLHLELELTRDPAVPREDRRAVPVR